MPKVRQDLQSNWAGGVVTSVRPEHLSEFTYPGAQNMQLRDIGGGRAILGTRPGLLQHNTTAISAQTVLAQYEYSRYSAGAFTRYHLAVTGAGKLKKIASNGTVSDADAGVATPFTSGEHYPDAAVANNLIFIVNGQENKKFNGTSVQDVGGAAPSAPTVADDGAAGNPDGTYEFAVSYYNSATGYETSRSAANSVTVTTNKIDVSWVAPSDSQFDYVRVHIRKGTLSGSFFRLTAGVDPAVDATHGGYAVATTATLVDITDAQFNALLIPSPSTTENNPPPVLDRICFHQGRLFGVDPDDPSTLLFSKLSTESVEAFDPNNTIPINVNDGDRITAIESSNELQLLIFKKNAVYALRGSYPDWEIETVSSSVGCTSHLSVLTHNRQAYFWSLHGPCSTDGLDVSMIGLKLADRLDDDSLQFSLLDKVAVGLDDIHLRILWSIPGFGKSRNTQILPYSLRLGVFESELWEMIDCASMTNVLNSDGVPRLYLGDYAGRVFKLDHLTFNDGLTSGTASNTGATVTYASDTLTDTSAAFLTTGSGLAQLYVIVKNSDGTITQRKRIGSNTATVLTLDTDETFDPVPDASWTYYIGGIDAVFQFGWKDGDGLPFWKKQLEYLTLDLVPPEGVIDLELRVFTDTNSVPDIVTTTLTGSEWDVSLWDAAIWGGALTTQHFRRRIGKCARTYLVTVQSVSTDLPFAIVAIGVRSKVLTEKT